MRADEIITAAVLQYYAEHRRVEFDLLLEFVTAKLKQRTGLLPERQHVEIVRDHLVNSGYIELKSDGTVLKVRKSLPKPKAQSKQTSWGWEK